MQPKAPLSKGAGDERLGSTGGRGPTPEGQGWRVPVIATLVVLLAVAAMIGLGLWQLQRLAWKQDLLARYSAARQIAAPLLLNSGTIPADAAYRRVVWPCPAVSADQVVGGSNASGQSGWAHVVVCGQPAGRRVPVVLGWSNAVAPIVWAGGTVTGVAVPGPKSGVVLTGAGALDWHIVADPPLAGLTANATPDPRNIPNNHFAYAIQWFVFAATALIIYLIALRRR